MQFAKADAIQAFPMPTISDDSPKKNATNGELKQQLTTDYSMMRNLTRPKGLSGQPSSTTQSGHQDSSVSGLIVPVKITMKPPSCSDLSLKAALKESVSVNSVSFVAICWLVREKSTT